MKPGIQWDDKVVMDFIYRHGRSFAPIKTPFGIQERLMMTLNRTLDGKCFSNARILSNLKPELYWYVEGYIPNWNPDAKKVYWMPHSWVSLRRYDEDWALDPTLVWSPFVEKFFYRGIRFDPKFALETKRRLCEEYESGGKEYPPGGLSLLSFHQILNGEIEGFKTLYAF